MLRRDNVGDEFKEDILKGPLVCEYLTNRDKSFDIEILRASFRHIRSK